MLLEADRVNQLESGMKNFVALVQDISSTRMKPFLEAQPLGRIVWCTKSILTVLVMMVNPSDILCYRVVGRLAPPSKYTTNKAVFWYLVSNCELCQRSLIYNYPRTNLSDNAVLM